MLVVSHDRAFLNEVATDIIHQHSERLDYYRGSNFDSFYATREERIKNQRREYESQLAYRNIYKSLLINSDIMLLELKKHSLVSRSWKIASVGATRR